MKKAIALVLLAACTLQVLYAPALVAWFYLDRARLAEKHCINKSRPELHCQGSCFLSKKIREAERQQQEDEKSSTPLSQWVQLSPCTLPAIMHEPLLVQTDEWSPGERSSHYKSVPAPGIFRPPLG